MISSISFLRLIFIFIIVVFHSGLSSSIGLPLLSGYVPVDFFFMLSGALMLKSIRGNISLMDYAKKRLSKFWLEVYLITFVLLLYYLPSFLKEFSYLEIVREWLSELFLLNCIIPDANPIGYLNSPMWFFNVMFYGGLVVFAISKINDIGIKIIIPVIVVIGYTVLFTNSSTIQQWDSYRPMLRGITDMSLGVGIGYLQEQKRVKSLLLDIIALIGLIVSLVLMNFRTFDLIYIVLFSILLYSSLQRESLINSTMSWQGWNYLARGVFCVYALHSPLMTLFNRIMPQNQPKAFYLFEYLTFLICASLFYYWGCSYLRTLLRGIPKRI